jgi:hypothetical protein
VGGVGLQHAAALGLVQRRGVLARQPLDQRALDLAGDGRQQLQRPLGGLAELPRRASTASRTVAGTSTSGLASTSVTKKGLPPVACSTARASAPCSAASSWTAPGDSRRSASRCTSWRASAPSTRRSGWSSRSSSSR